MGDSNGAPIQRIIGVPTYTVIGSTKTEYVTEREPSYFRDLMDVFKYYPVFKHYGLTPADAMSLPVDQWYKIREEVKTLPEEQDKHEETMMEVLKELVKQRKQESE